MEVDDERYPQALAAADLALAVNPEEVARG